MNLFTKETLITAASLGAGAVAAKVVHSKVLPMVPVAIVQNPNVQNLITLGLGILTPVVLKTPIGKGLGAGMIATSVAGLVSPYLASAGIAGTNDVFLGQVLETPSSGVLMGATETFEAPSNDFTNGGSGEADF